ncbi:MAG: hypothetical protein ACREX9_09105 [Gammaproteobacteria bacterium]
MSGNWKEVVRLRFTGDRFRDHALDLGALSELSQFQKIVAETAKALWRAANPGRERLPWHFEERTRLCLRYLLASRTTWIITFMAHLANEGRIRRYPVLDCDYQASRRMAECGSPSQGGTG